MECPADPPKEQSAFLLFIAYPQKHASFSKHFVPFFYCLPQQLWCFYFSLLSLSFQESFQQLVSTVSQGPLLYHGRVESCITGEGSHFHQFSLSRLYVLSLLDSAPSGSNPMLSQLCRYVMARSCSAFGIGFVFPSADSEPDWPSYVMI